MKIDDREDALQVAKQIANAETLAVAKKLLEAHLEGIDQARSQFSQGKTYEQISKELDARRAFVQAEISR